MSYWVWYSVLSAALLITALLFKFHKSKTPVALSGNDLRYSTLRDLAQQHEVASRLSRLVNRDGAGTWPPKCNYGRWPAALRPYQEIYQEMVPDFPSAEASLDDDVNNKRRAAFRARMRKLLDERISIPEVEELLEAKEDGDLSQLSLDKFNAFYCSVAVCRHMYR